MELPDNFLEEEDREEINNLSLTIRMLADIFNESGGTTEGLRMGAAAFRQSADRFDQIADRIEREAE